MEPTSNLPFLSGIKEKLKQRLTAEVRQKTASEVDGLHREVREFLKPIGSKEGGLNGVVRKGFFVSMNNVYFNLKLYCVLNIILLL